MRFIMHVLCPPEKFNKAVLDGSAGPKIGRMLEEMKPEGAYFAAEHGQRGGFFVVNLASNADMPRVAEPWFLNFDASVEFLPVMTPEDLQKSGLDDIAKKWK